MRRRTARIVLATLATLFFLRVLGQLWVAIDAPAWLPPFDQWESGLLPYGALLAAQVVVLALLAKTLRDLAHDSGWAAPNRARSRWLVRSGSIYAGVMIVRWPIQMWLRPELRWFGDTIPILFHVVLASFLIVLGIARRPQAHS